MAWSDAARAAAAEARRMHARQRLYTSGKSLDRSMHVTRYEMARSLREMRGVGLRGAALLKNVTTLSSWGMGKNTTKVYTNVKGAHFVDQGLGGLVWRAGKGSNTAPRGGVPKWAASQVKYTKTRY